MYQSWAEGMNINIVPITSILALYGTNVTMGGPKEVADGNQPAGIASVIIIF